MKDGTVYDRELGPRLTLSGEAVTEKFRANASLVLDAQAVERVVTLVQDLEWLADTNELMDAVTAGAGSPARAPV